MGVLANLRYRRLYKEHLACLQVPSSCVPSSTPLAASKAPSKYKSGMCSAGALTLPDQVSTDKASHLEEPEPQEANKQQRFELLHKRAACLLAAAGSGFNATAATEDPAGGQRKQQLLRAAKQRLSPYQSKVATKQRVSSYAPGRWEGRCKCWCS